MIDAADSAALLTKSALKQRGWTEGAIKRFLGPPDAVKPNPVYRSATPMQLWNAARIAAVEESDDFRRWQERSKTARQAQSLRMLAQHQQTRSESTAWASTVAINVAALSHSTLIRRACAAYNDLPRTLEHGAYATPSDSPEFLERISVNYLRHECTDYDRLLTERFGVTGVAEAQTILRQRVYTAIASAYPHLAAECARQLEERS